MPDSTLLGLGWLVGLDSVHGSPKDQVCQALSPQTAMLSLKVTNPRATRAGTESPNVKWTSFPSLVLATVKL